MTATEPHWEDEWRVARITLDAPPGNILDRAMIAALHQAFAAAVAGPECCLVVFEGAGEHFSYGASIPEHLPPTVTSLLAEFHALVAAMLRADVPTLALVRGRCLGGGLELAAACDFLITADDANLAFPEIRLGVFPPAASALLPRKLGHTKVAPLLLGGVALTGAEAEQAGLATHSFAADRLEASYEAWLRATLLPHSSASLRAATRAARLPWCEPLLANLAALERLYLERFSTLPDAAEGLDAFLAKRRPVWSHHG